MAIDINYLASELEKNHDFIVVKNIYESLTSNISTSDVITSFVGINTAEAILETPDEFFNLITCLANYLVYRLTIQIVLLKIKATLVHKDIKWQQTLSDGRLFDCRLYEAVIHDWDLCSGIAGSLNVELKNGGATAVIANIDIYHSIIKSDKLQALEKYNSIKLATEGRLAFYKDCYATGMTLKTFSLDSLKEFIRGYLNLNYIKI